MSRLNQVLNQTEVAEEKQKRQNKKKDKVLPVYDMKGQNITPEKKKRDKRIAITLLSVSAVVAILYFPGYFMSSKNDNSIKDVTVQTDSTAIRKMNNILRNYPTDDFDGDGLTNSEEITLGTDPWNIDTDGDGASDYYETKISNTDPLSSDDILTDVQTKEDKSKGKKVGSPFKIGNVILWADDYTSKAYGTVVETTSGYHFCDFNGYAQFPSGKYAYKIKNGVRTLLSYRKEENAWKVSAGDIVEVYDKPLEEIVEFKIFSKVVYTESNTITDIFAKILPAKGFLTAEKKMKIDVEPDTNKDTVTNIIKPAFDSTDEYRFTVNNNTLNDLQFVRKSIEEDDCCIAVSLFNQDAGEYLGIIYGYTSDGDLMIADMNSLEPVGILKITESAKKMIDENGDLVSVSYFDFDGLGFHSAAGDRISFFASSSKTKATNSKFKKENTDDSKLEKSNREDTTETEKSSKESISKEKEESKDSEEQTENNKEDVGAGDTSSNSANNNQETNSSNVEQK